MSALGSLVVKLALEYAEYTRGLGKGEQEALAFAKRVQGHFDVMGEGIKGVLGGIAAGIAGAFTVNAIFGGLRQAVDEMDKLSKASASLGIPTERLAGLKFAAELSGLAFEDLSTAIGKLSKHAASGGEVFKRIGIDAKDSSGHIKSNEQLLQEVANKFAGYANGAEKAALAQALFEDAGARMIPFLNQGAAGLAEMQAQAERLGLTFDNATGQAAEKFNDTLSVAHKSLDGIFTQVAAKTLPALQSTADAFLSAAAAEETTTTISNLLTFAIRGIATAVVFVGSAFKQFGTLLGGVAAGIVQIIGGIKTAFVGGVDDIFTALQTVARAAAALVKGDVQGAMDIAREGFGSLGQGVRQGAAEITTGASIIGQTFADVSEMGRATGQTIRDIWTGSGEGVATLVENIKKPVAPTEELGKAAKAAADEYAKLLGSWSERIAALNAEGAATEKLSATQTAYNQLQAQLSSGASKLTAEQKEQALAFAAAAVAIDKANKVKAESAKAAAEAVKRQAADEAARVAAIFDEAKSLDRLVAEEEERVAVIGMSSQALYEHRLQQLDDAIAAKQRALASREAAAGDDAGTEAIRDQIAALERLKELSVTGHNKEQRLAAADDTADMWRSIDNVAHETFTSIENGNKGLWQRVKESAKNMFFDWLYSMTIKRWIINIATNVSGASVAQQAFGAAASSVGGGGGGGGAGDLAVNLAGNQAVGSMGGAAGLISAGASMFAGTAVGAFGAGMASGVAAFGSLSASAATFAAGATAGGAVGAGMMIGAVAPYLAIIIALASALGAFNGPSYHSGAAVLTGEDGSQELLKHEQKVGDTRVWGGFTETSADGGAAYADPLKAFGNSVKGAIEGTLHEFGINRSYSVYTAFGADGEDKSRGALRVYDDNGDLVAANSDQALRGHKYNKDPKKGFEQFTDDAGEVIRDALVSADLPGWVDSILTDLGKGIGMAELNDALTQISAIKSAAELAGEEFGFTAEQLAGVTEQSGSWKTTMSGLSALMDVTLTANERWNYAIEGMARRFADLGVAVPRNTEEFRTLLKGIDLTTESGRDLYGSLLDLYPAFAQLANAVDAVFAHITASTSSLVEQFQTDIMSNAEKYKFLDSRIDATLAELEKATDPATIQSLYDKASADLKSAWALLDDDEKRRLSKQYQERAADLEQKSKDRLSVAPPEQSDEVKDRMENAADKQEKAADKSETAAGDMVSAAQDMLDAAAAMRDTAAKLSDAIKSIPERIVLQGGSGGEVIFA